MLCIYYINKSRCFKLSLELHGIMAFNVLKGELELVHENSEANKKEHLELCTKGNEAKFCARKSDGAEI